MNKKMKNLLYSMLVLFGFAGAVQAQTVTVADVEALPGETVTATLHLEAPADTYTGTRFALQFPTTGFTMAATGAASGWSGSLEYGTMTAGKVKFATAASKTFEVATIDVQFTVDDALALGDYDVAVTDIVFEGTGKKDAAADVTFTVKVVAAHSILLDETSATVPEAAANVNVRVKRTINANEWSTICLPFAMTEAQVYQAFGNDVQLAEYIEHEINAEKTAIIITFEDAILSEDGLMANYPYIIKTTKDITEFTVDGVTIDPDEEGALAEYTNGRSGSRKEVYGTFKGTYHAQTVVPENSLFLSGNQFWYSKGLTKMKAFRAYLSLADVLASVEDAGSRISMKFVDESTTTGIKNNKRETINDDRYYNLSGQRVEKPVKGIYVKEGRKVVIK